MNGCGRYIMVNRRPVPARSMWAYQDADERRVAKTIEGEVGVSTVFLQFDHGFCGEHLWFETMVFGGLFDGECERYETYEQAEAGHKAMCERIGIYADISGSQD